MSNEITSRSPNEELTHEQAQQSLNSRIQTLLGYDPNPPKEGESRPYQLSSTLWQRETHSKLGEHVFISFNDHSESEHYLPAQFFIQVYGSEHSRNTPQVIDDMRWTEAQDPSQLFADQMDRIEELIGLFKAPEEPTDG